MSTIARELLIVEDDAEIRLFLKTSLAAEGFAVFAAEGEVGAATGVRVLPADPGLDRLLRARRTRATFGNQVTRTTGSGVEFAEIRAMQPGDRSRAESLAGRRRGCSASY